MQAFVYDGEIRALLSLRWTTKSRGKNVSIGLDGSKKRCQNVNGTMDETDEDETDGGGTK